jgi:hypothetical protein
MATGPTANPTPASPPPRNNAVWWILGILGGGLVVLLCFGVMFGTYVARRIHVSEAGKKVEISTPVGSLQVNPGPSRETGLPVYPGATADSSEGANVEFAPAVGERVGVAAAKYFSSDSLEKVSDWYAERLGSEFTREKPGRRIHRIQGVNAGNADVAFISDNGEQMRIVALKRKDDGVEVSLARVGKQEAQ